MDRQDNGHFAPGNPGGPGRPKGSRSKLSEAYLKALADDFEEYGLDTIVRLREERPDVYVGAIGKLMPKLMDIAVEGDVTVSGIKVKFDDGS